MGAGAIINAMLAAQSFLFLTFLVVLVGILRGSRLRLSHPSGDTTNTHWCAAGPFQLASMAYTTYAQVLCP